ncbi:sugar ABC transporter substrate-binding protein [Microbacterium caowuchunii]|uniref:sugar ABC transporter substrate-binding protein n=1 Tax=Microbacterium caowuchunii TaxID=2614638 RepID=UPI001245FE6B|nr:substrate-binding domain-containing protein [Microbacterium caowuchunii]QEV99483.1 sugar ABC transporter substrate-binding protein [Microbacterium caowuchunii]
MPGQRRGARAGGTRRVGTAALAAVGLAAALSGCVGPASDAGADRARESIALLLPEAKTARYETFDRPLFEARVRELGDHPVLYANAGQNAATQQQQAESALAAGAGVLVLDPVDADAAVSIVTAANAAGVPVISYDRLVAGGDIAYFVSFDNERVGRLQATAFVEAVRDAGDGDGILMVNGSPTDSNADQFRQGAHAVIDRSGLRVLAEYDTPDWSPDKAQDWVAGQIAQYGDEIAGVYAANDGTAGGAISALKAAGAEPFPIVTGQDAELAAVQRIVVGDQYMTVYKAIRTQAEHAAEVAVALLRGEEVTAPTLVDGVPAVLLEPVPVTAADIMATVVADGFWTVGDICSPPYADACATAGIG